MSKSTKWLYFFLGLLCLNLFLFNGQISLWDEDEAAYAGFASTMLESGNWIQPEFLWSNIHRKTPLHFWSMAASYKLFGINEWATRLTSAMAVLLTCFVLLKWGALVFGKEVARWATIVLATSLVIPIIGKIALTDATLLFYQTSAVLALFNYLKAPNWKWNVYFWLSMSLGILTKGPLIIILCGGIWLFLYVFHPKRKTLVGLHPWFFGLFALLPTAYWMYSSWQQDGGELIGFLYNWYLVERVGGSVLGQTGFPGYHFLVLLIAFLPWLAFLIPGLAKQFRYFRKKEDPALLISGWLIFGWLFFELMSSKLPSYALAAHPAIALIIGMQIVSFLESKNKTISGLVFKSWIGSVSVIAITAVVLPYSIYHSFNTETLLPYLVFSISAFLLLGFQVYVFRRKHLRTFIYSLSATGWGITFLVITCLLPIVEISPMKALKEVASLADELAGDMGLDSEDLTVAFVDLGNKQTKISLPFYISRYFYAYSDTPKREALNLFLSDKPTIIITNEEALLFFNGAFYNRDMEVTEIKRVEWWSTDDKLGRHDYVLLWNF